MSRTFLNTSPVGGINGIKTLMGWNQAVSLTGVAGDTDSLVFSGSTSGILRVNSYNIGSKQEGDAPDFVTGATDRTAYTRGPVTLEGTLDFPLTVENATAGGVISGFSFFKAGALLSVYPGMSFSVQGATGESVGGCKVNSTTIKCDAKEHVSCTSTIWGVSETTSNVSQTGGTHPNGDAITENSKFGITTQTYGQPSGANVVGKFSVVQIPMWDAVQVIGAPDEMLVVGFSVTVDNALVRNYTLGNQTGVSPFGLNATSISAKQRKITGTIKWQSAMDGTFKAIMGSGIKQLIIDIVNVGKMTLTNCLWNAAPPTISTGDRMVCESSFTALGLNGAFDAISFSAPTTES